MVVVPLSKPAEDPAGMPESAQSGLRVDRANLVRFAAAGSLLAGGALLLSGNRRAGMVAAAAGTALAMLDEKETLRLWWDALPVYLDEAQALLGRVQGAVDDIATQRQRLRTVLSR
ncbi:MAG: hypothetical protein ACRD3N_12790 [Terracidiphilus sp.]